MKLTPLLIFTLFTIGVSTAQLSCRYAINNNRYTCFLTMENSGGFDNFSSISGEHLSGYSDWSVLDIRADSGNSPIFPQIICRQFTEIIYIVIIRNIGLQRLTEHSFAHCLHLKWLELRNNFVTEVTPETLKNNVGISKFYLINTRVTTLPEDLFSNTRFLDFIDISNNPTLNDLPANIFKDLNRITWLYLNHNRLNIWRPEWTQKSSNLITLSIYQNYHIPEIPRNVINSKDLINLWIGVNYYRSIDYFSFNDIGSVTQIHINDQPLDAIDFNFIDQAKSLQRLYMTNANCLSHDFRDFHVNRTEYLRLLEPCFVAFDKRILG